MVTLPETLSLTFSDRGAPFAVAQPDPSFEQGNAALVCCFCNPPMFIARFNPPETRNALGFF